MKPNEQGKVSHPDDDDGGAHDTSNNSVDMQLSRRPLDVAQIEDEYNALT